MRGAGDVETEAERKQVEGGGVTGAQGLSLLDVKPLRQKDGGDVHCSTCPGNSVSVTACRRRR